MRRIYYETGPYIKITTPEEWSAAPLSGVQVIVDMDHVGPSGWTYPINGVNVSVKDRQMFTGEDEYDPFGWGVKYGSLISGDQYFAIWERACGDD